MDSATGRLSERNTSALESLAVLPPDSLASDIHICPYVAAPNQNNQCQVFALFRPQFGISLHYHRRVIGL